MQVLCVFASQAANTSLPEKFLPEDSLASQICPFERLVIEKIEFSGNKKTKEYILLAELDFKTGDTISLSEIDKRLEKNRLRLFNLQLFHWTKSEVVSCDNGRITILFSVQERWYLWPVPVFNLADRNLSAWLNKMDFNRIDYGLYLVQYNFRGRDERLKLYLIHGFNRKYELQYTAPRFRRASNWGMLAGVSFFQSHFIDYTTRDSKPVTYRNDTEFTNQRRYIQGGISYRKSLQKQNLLLVSYNWQQISDSVFLLNPDYLLGQKKREFVDVEFSRTHNFRNTFSYPLSGHYAKLTVKQSVPVSGGASALTSVNLKYSVYEPLGHNFYYAIGAQAETKFADRFVYPDNQGLGYTSFVRGYELYVADGQHYGLLKQGLSYGLLTKKQINLKFFNNPKFSQIPISVYLNTFLDAGYVKGDFYRAENKNTSNRALYGTGLGIHFVTYYDRVITFEYSINRDGQKGLYIRGGLLF